MDKSKIAAAVAMAARTKFLIVSTAGQDCEPHIAVAGRMETQGELLSISSWYCPVTLANIELHPKISVAVWDAGTDTGYQLIGKLERLYDLAMLDSFAPQIESVAVYPQVERQLVIRVEKIMHFSMGLHADTEE
jgi:hypothetical protein